MKLSDLNLHDIGNTIQLVGSIYQGNGTTYLCVFPDEEVAGQYERLDMGPIEWETFLRQTDLMETEVQARAKDGTLHKAIVRKSQRQIEQTVSWKVFKRDQYRCRYCGRDDVPLTVDHLVLWEQGGPSSEVNLVAADKKCNRTRGNTPYAEWLEHPYYKKVSQGLTEAERENNRALLGTLAGIPRAVQQRSR